MADSRQQGMKRSEATHEEWLRGREKLREIEKKWPEEKERGQNDENNDKETKSVE